MKFPFQIIDRQPGFIVVDKPAGIGFHDESGQIGFFNLVKSSLSLSELYPVHRLDKMTSGLLLLATTKEMATIFQQLFEDKQIEKYYLAISDQKPKKKQGLIKGDMEKSRRGMWKITRTTNNPAISQFFSYSLINKRRLFVVKPLTGKTHQIRVALASIGSPIIGDVYYSKSEADRGYLHAYCLKFSLQGQHYCYQKAPSTGELFLSEHCSCQLAQIRAPYLLNWPTI